jgi:excisionase family DNA binding protein
MSFVFHDLFPDERSYRPGEVAKRLGVHVDTVRRWTIEQKIECFHLGGHRRIPYASIRLMTEAKLNAPHKSTENLRPNIA